MTYARLLHVGPEEGPHASFRDLWLPASEEAGSSAWETVDLSLSPNLIQARVDFLLRRYRPRVLVTHWEGAERLLPWVTYRNRVRLVCHRYRTDPMPLQPAHRMLYSMVHSFVVPAGALEEFIKATGVPERKIQKFRLCPTGIEVGEIDGVVLGILPASQGKSFPIRAHVETTSPEVVVLEGTISELLPRANILLDLGDGSGVQRAYLDGIRAGRHILVPDTDLYRSLYGESVTYYERPHLYRILREMFKKLPVLPKPPMADTSEAVRSITSAYRKAAA